MSRVNKINRELLKKAFDKSARDFDRDIERIIKKLNTIPKQYRPATRKQILKESAGTFVKLAKSNAPVNKLNKPRKVTLKKGGQVVYHPGNLRVSVGILPFKKTHSVFVGPKFRRSRKAGQQYGKTKRMSDAFYAGFLEFGTQNMAARPFMRPAYDQGKQKVMNDIQKGIERELKKWIMKNRVNK